MGAKRYDRFEGEKVEHHVFSLRAVRKMLTDKGFARGDTVSIKGTGKVKFVHHEPNNDGELERIHVIEVTQADLE